MNRPDGQFGELRRLTDALWDDEIRPQELARLEALVGASTAAKRHFLDYVHRRAEQERGASEPLPPKLSSLMRVESAWRSLRLPLLGRASPRVWVGVAAGLLIAVTLGLFAVSGIRTGGREIEVSEDTHHGTAAHTQASETEVARVSETAGARWADGRAPGRDARLVTGRTMVLSKGFAEIAFPDGARVILHAPAAFEPRSACSGFLREGRLTARVPPRAAGFAVYTPDATVVDLGTEFGIAVDPASHTDVEVFSGQVEVSLQAGTERTDAKHRLETNQALRIASADAGGPAGLQRTPPGRRHFLRSLPAAAAPIDPVAWLRRLAAGHPTLSHHYTFEGATPDERRGDKRGNLQLSEVAIGGGPAEGELRYAPAAFSTAGLAAQPFRAAQQGNQVGVGLQSESAFAPPAAMTVELLLRFDATEQDREGSIYAAVATRESCRRCAFLVAAKEQGEAVELVHLVDGHAPWISSGCFLVPGHWYYVASTFQTAGDRTTIDTYVADLTGGETTLSHVIRDQTAPGSPGSSRLGIATGFDGELAPAYPWSGALDEVAIYDAVLDRDTLAAHLQALVDGSSLRGDSASP